MRERQRAGRWSTVLFDFDDTLYDSGASFSAAFAAAAATAGLEDPDGQFPVFDRINRRLWAMVETHEIGPDDVRVRRMVEFVDQVGLDADPVAMADAFIDTLIAVGGLLPGAAELLATLADRCGVGLVTNGIGAVQRGRLARLGIADVFDVVVISGEVGVAKPHPAIFDLAFDGLDGVDRTATVMVGDSLTSDVAGARNADLDSIWINVAARDREVGSPAPTHEARSIGEVAELLG